jgi:uncharacterized protein DUF4288
LPTKSLARRQIQRSARYAAKLLFQFRVVSAKPAVRRLCEERIIVFRAKGRAAALAEAKRRGRVGEHAYRNNLGQPVYFELVGILDLLELGSEYRQDEVWYDLVERVRPMERRREIVPSEASLRAMRRS